MYNDPIEKKAALLISECGIKSLPISLEEIAAKKGLLIKPFDFGPDVSGALIIERGRGVIGFNPNDSKVRQRFTIAHEIGHYILHKPISNIFYDQTSNFSVQFRSEKMSKNAIHERQANVFAASLLMPRSFLISEIKRNHPNLSDEKSLKSLAKIFNVSSMAMAIRLRTIDLF